ncbi:MAG: GumC family protein [Brevundimonas sp.]
MIGNDLPGGRAPAAAPAGGKDEGLITYDTASREGGLLDFAEYWRLAVKHRFVLAGSFLGVLVLGIAATLLMTPIYTASTTLQIEREAARVLNVDDGTPRESLMQGEEFFQTQYGLLRSRSLAEQVVDSLGLANSDDFLTTMGEKPDEAGEGPASARLAARREQVLEVVGANLGVVPVRGSRLVSITFNSPDPRLSARIANSFAENFIRSNLERKYQSSSYARTFLEERIAQTKARLEDAERALVAYASSEQIINIQDNASADDRSQSLVQSSLVALNDALSEARGERIAAEQRWRNARSTSPMNIPEVLQNPAIQRLLEERAKVQAEYQQKSRIYQADWPEMRQLQGQIDEMTTQINTLAAGIRSSIQGQYTIALNAERALQAQVNGLKGDVLNLRDRSVQYNILERELDTSRTLYDGLLQRYKEVGITAGVSTNNISVIDPAEAPSRPSKPNFILNMLIAAILGLGLGVVVALVLEALDQSLTTPEDVETKLGLPVLGVVPLLDKGQSPLEALRDIRSSFSEAYYSLRTSLQFATPNGAPNVLLVTSARPAEGKSTTAYAIALSLARVGKRVMLIDGDLRNPSLHRVLGVDNDVGMSNLLAGSGTVETVVRQTEQTGLDFIACGPLPPSPAELWAGDRLRRLLADLTTRYDHIVIDGAPVLGFADAPILSAAVSGTIYVLESHGTRRAQARGALRRLMLGEGQVIGVVLTKFNTRAVQYGGYDYAYDYTYGENAKRTKRGR